VLCVRIGRAPQPLGARNHCSGVPRRHLALEITARNPFRDRSASNSALLRAVPCATSQAPSGASKQLSPRNRGSSKRRWIRQNVRGGRQCFTALQEATSCPKLDRRSGEAEGGEKGNPATLYHIRAADIFPKTPNAHIELILHRTKDVLVSLIAKPSECHRIAGLLRLSHKCAAGCTVVDASVRGSYMKRATLRHRQHAGITPTSFSCVGRRGRSRVGSFGCEELPGAEECVKLQKVAIFDTLPHQRRQTVTTNVVAFAHYVPSHGRFLEAEHAPLQPTTIHYCPLPPTTTHYHPLPFTTANIPYVDTIPTLEPWFQQNPQ
jgi:hypothetical protein